MEVNDWALNVNNNCIFKTTISRNFGIRTACIIIAHT